jgi:DNA mismatch repair protein MutS
MGEQQVEQRARRSAAQLSASGFQSILFERDDVDVGDAQEPSFFRDLNLDQVVVAITRGRDDYDLARFFYVPLRSVAAVEYRHEVFRDLEHNDVAEAIGAFAERIQSVRRRLGLAEKQYYKDEKERWFLDAAAIDCEAVSELTRALAGLDLSSRGLQGLRTYVTDYAASDSFTSLVEEAASVLEGLAGARCSSTSPTSSTVTGS